jgi:hypothetical protein
MNRIEQARELQRRVDNAFSAMFPLGYDSFTDPTIVGRYESIKGSLAIYLSEITNYIERINRDETENPPSA